MSFLRIRTIGDPVLREPCSDVERFDSMLRNLYEDMVTTMYKAPGVGLAAPQVGLSLRFFVFDPGDGSGPKGLANPVLSGLGGEQVEEEGCLSIPGLWCHTRRALAAGVEGLDVEGRPLVVKGEGLLARILQHETDHVNGVLFIDRLDDAERRRALATLRDRELGMEPPPRSRRP